MMNGVQVLRGLDVLRDVERGRVPATVARRDKLIELRRQALAIVREDKLLASRACWRVAALQGEPGADGWLELDGGRLQAPRLVPASGRLTGVACAVATLGAAITARIDALFANSRYETRTSSEKAFAQGFANQIGNIGAILTAVVSAVFFTMLLVTANTMAQSVRERTNELAVLKTLGFTNGGVMAMVLAEAVLLAVIGGAAGLALAALAVAGLADAIAQYLPVFKISSRTAVEATLLMLGLAIAAGAAPAWRALRLQIAAALRQV